MISVSKLKDISKETEISYQNLVAGAVTEAIICRIAESEFGKAFWLKNSYILGLEACKRRSERRIEYYYREDKRLRERDGFVAGQVYDEAFRAQFSDWIIEELSDLGLRAEGNFRDERTMMLNIYLEQIYLPMELSIEVVESDTIYPVEVEVEAVFDGGRKFICRQYPLEDLLSNHIFQVIRSLELLNEMEHYLRIYEILKSQVVSGRKLESKLMEYVQSEGLDLQANRLELLRKYRDYSYMKKKWKVLLRRQNLQEPSWEDVMDLLLAFLEPIYLAMMDDRIFLGDWMPQLGRFLD